MINVLWVLCICATVVMADSTPTRNWQIDPFRPSVAFFNNESEDILSVPITQKVTLKGIMQMGDSYRAMIDDRIVKEGDYVGEFLIQKILASRVLVTSSRGITYRVEFDDN